MAKRIEVAFAQFVGFNFGEENSSGALLSMVIAMGLTKKEWCEIKLEYEIMTYINEERINEIDEHFNI